MAPKFCVVAVRPSYLRPFHKTWFSVEHTRTNFRGTDLRNSFGYSWSTRWTICQENDEQSCLRYRSATRYTHAHHVPHAAHVENSKWRSSRSCCPSVGSFSWCMCSQGSCAKWDTINNLTDAMSSRCEQLQIFKQLKVSVHFMATVKCSKIAIQVVAALLAM